MMEVLRQLNQHMIQVEVFIFISSVCALSIRRGAWLDRWPFVGTVYMWLFILAGIFLLVSSFAMMMIGKAEPTHEPWLLSVPNEVVVVVVAISAILLAIAILVVYTQNRKRRARLEELLLRKLGRED